MVEYVGVIRKEALMLSPAQLAQISYATGDKPRPKRFTPETFMPHAAEVAVTGKRRAAARGFGTNTPDYKIPDSMTATQMYNMTEGANRGSDFANRWQRRGQGLGAALGGLAGMVSLANAGAQGQDLLSGGLNAYQTGSQVSDIASRKIGDTAGNVAGRIGVATHKPTKAPAGGTAEGYISAGGRVPPNEIGVRQPIALLPERAASLEQPVKPFSPVETQNQVRVKQHQGEFNVPEDGFVLGAIPTYNPETGKTGVGAGATYDMFGTNPAKTSQTFRNTVDWVNQQQPAAASLPPEQQVPVLPATAPMDTTNVQPVAPVQVSPPASSLDTPMTQTSAETALQGDPFAQQTEVQEAEGGVDALAEQKKHEAALLADPYANQNASSTTHGLEQKSTNPRRFVGVI